MPTPPDDPPSDRTDPAGSDAMRHADTANGESGATVADDDAASHGDEPREEER